MPKIRISARDTSVPTAGKWNKCYIIIQLPNLLWTITISAHSIKIENLINYTRTSDVYLLNEYIFVERCVVAVRRMGAGTAAGQCFLPLLLQSLRNEFLNKTLPTAHEKHPWQTCILGSYIHRLSALGFWFWHGEGGSIYIIKD